jgi:hypothetical protein
MRQLIPEVMSEAEKKLERIKDMEIIAATPTSQ